jgi:DNA-binding NtrC family response regulator
MRVGGTTKLDVDVRVVLATLRPLEEEVRAGRFRADLFYRIQGIVLTVPPLRERRRDIPAFIDAFVAQLSAIHDCEPPKLTRSTRAALLAHDWPGNVRQLRNAIEFVTILRSGKTVRVQDLPQGLGRAAGAPLDHTLTIDLDQPLDVLVDRIIEHAVAAEHGNLTRAAKRLGVSIRTLQRRRRA